MRSPAAAVVLLTALTITGCGRYYWTQPGQSLAGFQRDSQTCLDEIRTIKYPIEPAGIYRLCMTGRGWQRTQLPAPVHGAFRGAESEAEALGLRPIAQPDPSAIDAAKREACQERIRNLMLRPRSAYAEAFNRCMAEQ